MSCLMNMGSVKWSQMMRSLCKKIMFSIHTVKFDSKTKSSALSPCIPHSCSQQKGPWAALLLGHIPSTSYKQRNGESDKIAISRDLE